MQVFDNEDALWDNMGEQLIDGNLLLVHMVPTVVDDDVERCMSPGDCPQMAKDKTVSFPCWTTRSE